MVFGQSVLKRDEGSRYRSHCSHCKEHVLVNVAGFPFLFHIKKPSALCNFLLWLLTCWNCNASQFSNKLKGLCLFSLLLQASFWRLQIQFCGFLMLVFYFFFFQDPFKSLGWRRSSCTDTGPALSGMLFPLCFSKQGSQWDP